jgi:hypothetical protein
MEDVTHFKVDNAKENNKIKQKYVNHQARHSDERQDEVTVHV